jgi:hypothetical protein
MGGGGTIRLVMRDVVKKFGSADGGRQQRQKEEFGIWGRNHKN